MIEKSEVEKIARLARLELSENEIKKMQKDLSAILDYFNLLKEADTKKAVIRQRSWQESGKESFDLTQNVVREDKAMEKNNSLADDLLKMAPEREERHIKVKSVLQ